MKRIAIKSAGQHIAQRAEFTCHGALRGTGLITLYTDWGILPEPHKSDFKAGRSLRPTKPGDILYAVFSYATPIAWFTEANGWVIPDVKYSVTTSRHQGVVRRAVQ